ncbi:MAG TPA: hypothetical protein VF059_14115 [Casimicrobiaceae bacterium]
MAARANAPIATPAHSIPLLDASSLPSAEDWALLESLSAYSGATGEFEPDLDRYGRFRLSAAVDE